MFLKSYPRLLIILSILMLASLLLAACNLPIALKPQGADQTMAVIGQTQTAVQGPTTEVSGTSAAPAVTLEPVVHAVTPGSLPNTISFMEDVNNWDGGAEPVKAVGGDHYNMNNLERPFDTSMKYRPDLDIIRADLAMDATFFYITITLRDVSGENNALNGSYGVELDLDRNGRGDYLIWANPLTENASEWTSEGMLLLQDTNKNVGKITPLMADPPASGSGDGYETLLTDGSNRTGDLDAAWQRLASDSNKIQLAVKRSAVGSPTKFMWSVIADDGFKDPAKFDYNDQFTLAEAGSPLSGQYFPVKAVNLVDTTCRTRWGFNPTGREPGLCVGANPLPDLAPTRSSCVVTISGKFTDDKNYWASSWKDTTTVCIAGPGGIAQCKRPDAASGTFAFGGLPPGSYNITAFSTMFQVDPSAKSFSLQCNQQDYTKFLLYGPTGK